VGDVSHCSAVLDNATCVPICAPKYTWSGSLTCDNATWQVSGMCVLEGSNVVPSRVLQFTMALRLAADGEPMTQSELQSWAGDHLEELATATAAWVDVDSSRVLVEVLPAGGTERLRRLDTSRKLQAGYSPLGNLLYLRAIANLEADDGSNSSAVSDDFVTQIEQRLTNRSGGENSFGQHLTDALRSNGQPLVKLGVDEVSNVQVIESFPFPQAEWYVGSWGPCSASCVDGEQVRDVQCPVGHADACMQAAGAAPVSRRSCVAEVCHHATLVCPLGRDAFLPCGWQAILLCCVLVAVCLCVAACVTRAFAERQARAGATPKLGSQGSVTLDDLDIEARYSVSSDLTGSIESLPSVPDEGRTNLNTAPNEPEKEKVRIVWDLDIEAAMKQLNRKSTVALPVVESSSSIFSKSRSFASAKSLSASSLGSLLAPSPAPAPLPVVLERPPGGADMFDVHHHGFLRRDVGGGSGSNSASSSSDWGPPEEQVDALQGAFRPRRAIQ